MKKIKQITLVSVLLLIAGVIIYACTKDNLVSENAASEITAKNQKIISVGQLHNDILDAYLCALEADPAVDYIDFSAKYLNIDKDKLNIFVEGLTKELSKYPTMEKWFDNLAERGIYSLECLDIIRKIIELGANENLDVKAVVNFREEVFAGYKFHDEKEADLITETLSILEYSTQYWADEKKTHRWEIFRHDPINPDNKPTEGGCGTFDELMGGLYRMSQWGFSSTLMDAFGLVNAKAYADCINAEYGGTVQHYFGVDNVRLFCTAVSAKASSW